MNTELYKRASIQAQRNRNQYEQAERSYARFCRKERIIATIMFACILFAVGSILAAIVTAILHAILP